TVTVRQAVEDVLVGDALRRHESRERAAHDAEDCRNPKHTAHPRSFVEPPLAIVAIRPEAPYHGVAMPHAREESRRPRLRSLDIVRGLIMVVMAIDHVRVFSGVPAGGPAFGIFFTPWVTHFCAPGFVFFAGTAAYLHRLPNTTAISQFLVRRGLWLVLLELTVLRWAWTFNFDSHNYNLGGVLWILRLDM